MDRGECKAAVVQFVLADRTRLEVCGADRAKFLHNLCTNDVKALAPGQGCEAFFTNVQGKLLGHVFLFATGEAIVIDTVSNQGPPLAAHLERYHIREDVLIRDVSEDWSHVWLLGAEAAVLLASLAAPSEAAFLPTSRLTHTEMAIGGARVFAARAGWGDGFWLSCRTADIDRLTEALSGAGAPMRGMDELEAARLEAGFPEYGRDISDKNLPQEVDRDALAISFKKGCYLGQETVARIDALGHVNRLLRILRFSGDGVPPTGLEIFLNDKPVGVVTSAARYLRGNASIAMAMVRREASTPGLSLSTPMGEATVLDRA